MVNRKKCINICTDEVLPKYISIADTCIHVILMREIVFYCFMGGFNLSAYRFLTVNTSDLHFYL